mgnify:CR=1 FL=1
MAWVAEYFFVTLLCIAILEFLINLSFRFVQNEATTCVGKPPPGKFLCVYLNRKTNIQTEKILQEHSFNNKS